VKTNLDPTVSSPLLKLKLDNLGNFFPTYFGIIGYWITEGRKVFKNEESARNKDEILLKLFALNN